MAFRDFGRELTAAIRTTPSVIAAVGLGSLAILLAKILWLNYVPEAFSRVLGELAENILAATFAAYVFFLISYQVPQVIERRRIGRSVVRFARSVVLNASALYRPGGSRGGADGRRRPVAGEGLREGTPGRLGP